MRRLPLKPNGGHRPDLDVHCVIANGGLEGLTGRLADSAVTGKSSQRTLIQSGHGISERNVGYADLAACIAKT